MRHPIGLTHRAELGTNCQRVVTMPNSTVIVFNNLRSVVVAPPSGANDAIHWQQAI
jgi:hypothetical protein